MFPAGSWMMGVVTDQAAWKRLGEMIRDERIALGMNTREDLAKATGFSARFLADVEKGRRENYDDESLLRIELALGWQRDSIKAILAGGEPTRADTADDRDPIDEQFERDIADIRAIPDEQLPALHKNAMERYIRQLQRHHRAEREELLARQAVQLEELRVRQEVQRRDRLKAVLDMAQRGDDPDPQPAT